MVGSNQDYAIGIKEMQTEGFARPLPLRGL
jgi:hypothetical protein